MKRKRGTALLLSAVMAFTMAAVALPAIPAIAASTGVSMYRLYNPNSGEHFYTGAEKEKTDLVKAGWRDEGIGWIAPVKSNTPVYRLYNGNAGDHHYTLDVKEKNSLIGAGWKDEGIGWYSDDKKTAPLYREYNPNAVTGTHNYTADKTEHNHLVALGWTDEGIGWYAIEKIEKKPVEIGDTVIFGSYEQDNNYSNGKEAIEWKVLAKDGNKALVISRYALDCQPYNTQYTDVTWETCSLRKWLNGAFISNAFSSDEQKKIQTTTVTADKNPEYDSSPGNNTTDKVFLLSIPEAKRYFSSDEARMCAPTEYAKAQGVRTYDGYGYSADGKAAGDWWLRSPGYDSDDAASIAYVSFTGIIAIVHGNIDYSDTNGVRPALWINLES